MAFVHISLWQVCVCVCARRVLCARAGEPPAVPVKTVFIEALALVELLSALRAN